MPPHTIDSRRRELILEAAHQLLKHYGPHKTTVADIARAVGIGTGSVYLEFPSKDDLIAELAGRVHEQVIRTVRAAYQNKRGAPVVKLRAALEARIEAFLRLHQDGAHSCDLVHCGRTPQSPVWQLFEEREAALFSELIAEGAREGTFLARDPRRAAHALLSAYGRFSPPYLFSLAPVELRIQLDAMHDLVLFGLVRR